MTEPRAKVKEIFKKYRLAGGINRYNTRKFQSSMSPCILETDAKKNNKIHNFDPIIVKLCQNDQLVSW